MHPLLPETEATLMGSEETLHRLGLGLELSGRQGMLTTDGRANRVFRRTDFITDIFAFYTAFPAVLLIYACCSLHHLQ